MTASYTGITRESIALQSRGDFFFGKSKDTPLKLLHKLIIDEFC